MPVTVAKEFRWEMGHRLSYHEICRNIHGHSYRMVVEVTGEVNEGGMVIDFGEIASLVRPILERLDHSFMVDPWDEPMQRVLKETGLKSTPVTFYSTAENISKWIMDQIGPILLNSQNIAMVRLQLFETSSACAEVTLDRP